MAPPTGGANLTGDKALRRLLRALGPRIERKVTRGAMSKAATPIIKAGKSNARRLLGTRGGKGKAVTPRQLAKSIGKRVKSYTAQGTIFVAVGPRFPLGAHGHLVEFGHRSASGFVPPHPFMRPAWESQKRAALVIAIQEHRLRVEAEARKAAVAAGSTGTGGRP